MKKFFLLLSAFVVISAASGQTYFLNGNAIYVGGDCYQLTPMLSNMNGTVWYADQINLNQPFDLQFTMNFGFLDNNGADGICFVLQTVGTSAIGQSGGGMGYQNFGTSLGIEFDTYQNGNFGDPTYDHIAIEKNGDINHNSSGNIAGPVQASATSINIEDGQDHDVRITWNPDEQLLQVYFDCEFRLEGTVDLINEIFNGENLVYWGFTAATGGSTNIHTVCLREDILNITEVEICSGASIQLDVAGSIDGVYSWSPSDYFIDNPNSATPTVNPPATTVYTATFLDVCGNATQTEITVTVDTLEVTISEPGMLNCITPQTNLNTSVNFGTNISYNWFLNGEPVSSGNNQSTLSVNQPGTYTVEVNLNNQCYAEYSVEVNADFSTYELDAGENLVLDCNHDEVTILISVDDESVSSFNWFKNNEPLINEHSISLTTDEPGVYTVNTVHPISGCMSEDSMSVTEDYTQAQIFVGQQDSLTCIHPSILIENISITSENPYSITWSTVSGNIISGLNTLSPAVNQPGDYIITVIDDITGCASSAVANIEQAGNYGVDISQLVFPNIITPNGDFANAYWRPFYAQDRSMDLSEIFADFDLIVFNRWGKKVFETSDFSRAWDAKDVDDGIFYYTLRYSSNCAEGTFETHGNIHVAR